ncbi:response regulator [Syntrophotalea acetylenica]|uniref:response regulator n=1 Tax=Syntrophotalea acetylenica TaxID=29542 RepID=UPI000AF2CF7B|nr:response regulator [Syntrophotalea acetylenica]
MKSVLVVDDKPDIRSRLAESLMKYGFTDILEAENGQQAIDMTQAHHPLLIVMDYIMPVMDGITAAEIISKKCPAPSSC